jgi:hypothetical protein
MFRKRSQCALYFRSNIQDKSIDSALIIKRSLWSTSAEGWAVKFDYEISLLDCAETLASRIKNINNQYCLIQVDYSENFALIRQNEV